MKKLVQVLLILVLTVSLIGCSSTEKQEAAQGVTDTEILIANCAATSGAYAPIGVPFVAGIEAYVKYVNDQGGINGRKIKFLHQDDEFDPGKGKACLQKMVEDEKVFAIVGHFGTPVVAATLKDLKEWGIPTVYFATGIGQLYNDNAQGEDRIIYPVQPLYVTEGAIMVTRGVGDYNAKKIGIIYTNDDAGKDMLKGAQEKAKELGVELVEEQVAAGATDVSAAVTKIMSEDVDFIIGAAIQQTIPTIVKALAAQNNTSPVITTYVNVAPAISNQIKDDIKGKFDVLGNGWVDFTQPSAVAESEFYKANIAEEFHANAYAVTGWIAALTFVEGLRNMDADEVITWDNYMTALESKPVVNPYGGEISFANGNRAGTQVMNLSKVDEAGATGWVEIKPLQSIDEILGNK